MVWGTWGFWIGLAWAFSAQAVSLKDIERWVRQGEVRNLEEVLIRLPPDMRTHFVLMEKSRSLQEGSPDAPRAVLYGDSADLIVSFNGKAGQRGYQTLEAIEHDPARSTYVLRQFDFSGPKPRVSPPNPQVCLRCHRRIPRPNWEPYPYWPGALGQGPSYSQEEKKKLAEFAATSKHHPLYRHLNFRSGNSTPAFNLYTLLTEQNVRRVPRLLMATADYSQVRPAIQGALADCPDFFTWRGLPGTNIWGTLHHDTLRRFQMLPVPYQPLLTTAVPSVMAKLRHVLESRGFPLDSLPNSFTERFFLTAAGTVIPQILARLPGGSVPAPLPALSAYFHPGSRPYGASEKRAHAEYCASLKKEFE